jgi:outer membrane lipoprotein LolB
MIPKNINTLLHIIIMACTVTITACTTATKPQQLTPTMAPAPATHFDKTINKSIPVAAKTRQQQLLALNNWQTQGVLGVIRNQGKGFSGTFNWLQQRENYRVSIFAPLGTGSAHIQGNPSQVSMVDSKNRHASADNAEALLQKQIGISLPVSNLYYWMRGLPTPNGAAKTQFDKQQRLIHLEQDGWDIRYQHYITVNGLDLPDRMILVSPSMQAKFVIKQWTVL